MRMRITEVRELVREVLEDLDDLDRDEFPAHAALSKVDDMTYDMVARQLVGLYSDNTIDQDLSKLVDTYVRSHKASHGVELDSEKLYDAVVERMTSRFVGPGGRSGF